METLLKRDITSFGTSINTKVSVFAPKGWNNYEIGSPVNIVINVIGKEPVIFPNDYNITVYKKENQSWIKVDLEEVHYLDGDRLLEPSQGDVAHYGSLMLIPILPDNIPVLIRVVVLGNSYSDGKKSNLLVYGYTDIWIYPENK